MSIYGEQIKQQFDQAVEKGFNGFEIEVHGILDSEDFRLIEALGLGYTVESVSSNHTPLKKDKDSAGEARAFEVVCAFEVVKESYDRFIFSVQQPRKPEHIKILNTLRDNFERYYPKDEVLISDNVYYFMVNPSGIAVIVPVMQAMVPGAIYVKAKKPLKKSIAKEHAALVEILSTLPKASCSEWEAIFRMIGWL